MRLDDAEKGLWTAGVLPKDHGYSLPRMIQHLGGYCWHPLEVSLTREALDEAHRLGIKVVVWGSPEQEGTEFSYPTVEKMIEWGVDGIITDRPDILRGLLVARGIDVPKGFAIGS